MNWHGGNPAMLFSPKAQHNNIIGKGRAQRIHV